MNRNPLVRNMLVIGIILLFIGTGIIPSTAQDIEKPSLPTSRGNWLYVGGSGPGNYSKIQDAINDSHDGDTVFVYSGSYSERIVIPNAIHLIGESKNTTIIDAEIPPNAVLISLLSNYITISGFTLRCTTEYSGSIISNSPYYAFLQNITISDIIFKGTMLWAIYFYGCNFCTITQNTFYSNYSIGIYLRNGLNWTITNNTMNAVGQGILLEYTSHSIISNNSIISNHVGLTIKNSFFTTISNNYFFNNSKAIYMEGYSNYNSIISNHIDNPIWKIWSPYELIGIHLSDDNYNTRIEKNIITHCILGIIVENSYSSNISMNTFMKNRVHARFYSKYNTMTTWNQNYWGRPRILPKPIFGIEDIYHSSPDFIQFDWHPAQEPYDIP